ncbi:MAG: phosphatidate cytidylyltransferase [Burkholderiaceae bacterium]
MGLRILTAVVLFAVLIPLTLWAPVALFSFFVLLVFCGVFWEWSGLLTTPMGPRIALVAALLVLGATLVFDPYLDPRSLNTEVLGTASLVWLLFLPWALWQGRSPRGLLGLGLAVVGCFAGFWAVWQARYEGLVFLVSVLLLVWSADTAAYFAGKAFGRRRLAPTISPGKTWEGVLGALVVNLLVMTALALFVFESWSARLIDQLGLVPFLFAILGLTGYSVMGDLHQSLLKRQAAVKDSGQLLPGHGGLFDRLDAVVVVMPLAVFIEVWAESWI